MSLVTTGHSFVGKHAGVYIGAALKAAKSLDNITLLEGIKYKAVVNGASTTGMIADASCGFTDAGSLTLTERVLTPKRLQINTDFCRETLLAHWQSNDLAAGADNVMSEEFAAFVMEYVGSAMADAIEASIWDGNDANGGQFTGFTTDTVGTMVADSNVVDVASVTLTVGNIIAQMERVVDAIPTAVYGKSDLNIYVGSATYRLYVQALSALGYATGAIFGDNPINFQGINLVMCPGLPADTMVAAQKSNLFFGTDLLDDVSLKIMDMGAIDGSDNIRLVARFSGAVQHGNGADVVLYK